MPQVAQQPAPAAMFQRSLRSPAISKNNMATHHCLHNSDLLKLASSLRTNLEDMPDNLPYQTDMRAKTYHSVLSMLFHNPSWHLTHNWWCGIGDREIGSMLRHIEEFVDAIHNEREMLIHHQDSGLTREMLREFKALSQECDMAKKHSFRGRRRAWMCRFEGHRCRLQLAQHPANIPKLNWWYGLSDDHLRNALYAIQDDINEYYESHP